MACTSVDVAFSHLSVNVLTGGVHVSHLSGNVHTGGVHMGLADCSPDLPVASMATHAESSARSTTELGTSVVFSLRDTYGRSRRSL